METKLIRQFNHDLRDKLLSDHYSKWRNVDRDTLESLFERVGEEVEEILTNMQAEHNRQIELIRFYNRPRIEEKTNVR